MYKLTNGPQIFCVSSGFFFEPDPRNLDYQAYLLWLDAGNTPDPAPAPPVEPSYVGFYDGLLTSIAYQKIRQQGSTSLPLTLAAVEFSAAMSDAKAGRPNIPALQACLANIKATATDLDADDWAEIGELLAANHLTAFEVA